MVWCGTEACSERVALTLTWPGPRPTSWPARRQSHFLPLPGPVLPFPQNHRSRSRQQVTVSPSTLLLSPDSLKTEQLQRGERARSLGARGLMSDFFPCDKEFDLLPARAQAECLGVPADWRSVSWSGARSVTGALAWTVCNRLLPQFRESRCLPSRLANEVLSR